MDGGGWVIEIGDPDLPFWAGTGTVWFGALLGFIGGMFFTEGSWLGGGVAAVIIGGVFFVLRMAFGGSDIRRPAFMRLAGLGAVAGFVVTFVLTVGSDRDFSLIGGAALGAVAGLLLSIGLDVIKHLCTAKRRGVN